MKFSKHFRIKPGAHVDLDTYDTRDTAGFDKDSALERMNTNTEILADQHYVMYAENRRSLLIVLQGMDTSGKDGVIRHVMHGINPQGCTVTSFKAPSTEEADHDYLWRIHRAVPARGDIGIFNRSHYEDVLITRVRGWISKDECKERFKQINHFEKMLSQNGTTIVKFFLHISNKEQKERLQARLDDPQKNWKFSENDLKERTHWKNYRHAYEALLGACSTPWAPWYVIPSDKKWFRNFAISNIIVETMRDMKLQLPPPLPSAQKIKIV